MWRLLRPGRNTAQRRTLTRIASALQVDVSWLAGQDVPEQLGIWPSAVPDELATLAPELLISRLLRRVPMALRTQVARSAVAELIELMTASGQTPDRDVYTALLSLDSARVAETARARQMGGSSGKERATG